MGGSWRRKGHGTSLKRGFWKREEPVVLVVTVPSSNVNVVSQVVLSDSHGEFVETQTLFLSPENAKREWRLCETEMNIDHLVPRSENSGSSATRSCKPTHGPVAYAVVLGTNKSQSEIFERWRDSWEIP